MKRQLVLAFLLILSLNAKAQDEVASEDSELMGRTHNVRLGLSYGATTVEDADQTNINVDAEYRYNLGYIEPGIKLSYTSWANEPGYPGEDVSYSLVVRGNAVKNEPGRNFIPYGELGISFVANEDENDTAYTTESGQPISFGIGMQIFPFGQIFAFDIALIRSSGTYEWTSDAGSGTETEVDSATTQLRVGYTLSFK